MPKFLSVFLILIWTSGAFCLPAVQLESIETQTMDGKVVYRANEKVLVSEDRYRMTGEYSILPLDSKGAAKGEEQKWKGERGIHLVGYVRDVVIQDPKEFQCFDFGHMSQVKAATLTSFVPKVKKTNKKKKILELEATGFDFSARGEWKEEKSSEVRTFSVEGMIWVVANNSLPNENWETVSTFSTKYKIEYMSEPGFLFRDIPEIEEFLSANCLKDRHQVRPALQAALKAVSGFILERDLVLKANGIGTRVGSYVVTKVEKRDVTETEFDAEKTTPKKFSGPFEPLDPELKMLSEHNRGFKPAEAKAEADRIFKLICKAQTRYFAEKNRFASLESMPIIKPAIDPIEATTCVPMGSESRCNLWNQLDILPEKQKLWFQYQVEADQVGKDARYEATALGDFNGNSVPSKLVAIGTIDPKSNQPVCGPVRDEATSR